MRSIRYRADRLGKQILQGPLGQTVGQPDRAVDQDILHKVFVLWFKSQIVFFSFIGLSNLPIKLSRWTEGEFSIL